MSNYIFFDEKQNIYYSKKIEGEVSKLYLLNGNKTIITKYQILLDRYNPSKNKFKNEKLNNQVYSFLNTLVNEDLSIGDKKNKFKTNAINNMNYIIKNSNEKNKIELNKLVKNISKKGNKWAQRLMITFDNLLNINMS